MTTAGAYLPWEGEVTTITKISKPNSPFHEARHQLGPAQEMMQNTLSITDKFASSGGPSSGDDGGWSQSGDMQWDVDVNAGYDIISDNFTRLDASNPGDPTPFFDPNPCARMAARAKKVWGEVLKTVINDPKTPQNANFNNLALPLFDFNFTTLYTGHIVNGSWESVQKLAKGGGTNSSSKDEMGQQDFKDKYIDADFPRDSDKQGADQVHHFAAYFSAGLNAAALSSTAHEMTDTELPGVGRGIWAGANKGDINLANDAFALGYEARKDPGKIMTHIETEIKTRFCR